jgi:gluconolactonase
MTRTFSLLVGLSLAAFGYACSSAGSSSTRTDPNNPTLPGAGDGAPAAPGGDPGATPGGAPDGAGGTATPAPSNPIEGIPPASLALLVDAYTDGPAWHSGLGALFFTTPLGNGTLYRLNLDGSVMVIRDGNSAQGTTPIGNAVFSNGDLVTVDAKRIVRTAVAADAGAAAPRVVATGYTGAAGPATFDTLKSVAARKDGTLYVTDPGYFMTAPVANRLYRISAAGVVQVVDTFEDVSRPNGIVLAPDHNTLYVGFTQPIQGQLPFIRQYAVNADGTLGAYKKLVDLAPMDSTPDGLAVDSAGDVYVAAKDGVRVFKSDGTVIGTVPVPEKPTGMAFGGTDLKTLYVTTEGTRIWELHLNVAGVK